MGKTPHQKQRTEGVYASWTFVEKDCVLSKLEKVEEFSYNAHVLGTTLY